MRGVVAAGHPLTAEAGADVLRAGGNAVDAAVACVLMSFVAESPLTGPGAGGFMLVHTGVAGGPPARLLRGRPGPRAGARPSRPSSCRSTCISQPTPCSASTSGRPRWAPTGPPWGWPRRSSASAAARSESSPPGPPPRPARGSPWCRCRPSCSRCSSRSSAPRRSARSSTRRAGGYWARASCGASPSSATCSIGWAPRARPSSTRATWRPRPASSCSSAAACSRAPTWPATR